MMLGTFVPVLTASGGLLTGFTDFFVKHLNFSVTTPPAIELSLCAELPTQFHGNTHTYCFLIDEIYAGHSLYTKHTS
jgi:hypothetical protein